MQGVSKISVQCYSKCYCVTGVTKMFTLKGVQTIQRERCSVRLYSSCVFKCKRFHKTRCLVIFEIPLHNFFKYLVFSSFQLFSFSIRLQMEPLLLCVRNLSGVILYIIFI
jgi:hypothetical protein